MRSTLTHGLVAVIAVGATIAVAQVRRAPSIDAGESSKPPAENRQAGQDLGASTIHIAQPDAAPPSQLDPHVSVEEQTNIRVYEQVNRSVVHITTRSVQVDDFFFQAVPSEGTGSGSVLDKQGHILTNFHVIENARRVLITLYDSNTYEARLVGGDPSNDIAVLKIDAPAEKLQPIAWGDSQRLKVGMHVFAIGNPFGLERTLTIGIVSSLNRSLRTDNNRLVRGVIQTDAAINPGNSGGPLVNRQGEMVGITTAIIANAGQSAGIGLAIPASTSKRIVDELIKYGKVIRPDCGILRVLHLDEGLLISRLAKGGPAHKAGLRGPEILIVQRGGIEYRTIDRSKADIIVAVDGKPTRTADDFLAIIESKKPGGQATITVLREGEKLDVAVELVESKE
ncbi:MAG: S1C family serine protease [Gemmataceae bacterium]